MINFTMSSVVMAVLLSNVLIVFVGLLFRNKSLLVRLGYPVLLVTLTFTMIRLVLPIELPFTTNIYYPESISKYIQMFLHPNDLGISPWNIFCVIWCIGTIILAVRYIIAYVRFSGIIKTKGIRMANLANYPFMRSAPDVYLLDGITSPMLFGLYKPAVLIPIDMSYSEDELYAILRHEYEHLTHHDLYVKLFADILRLVYWWNPFMIFLSRQVETILEIHTDRHIIDTSSTEDAITYLSTLKKVAESSYAGLHDLPTIAFNHSSSDLFSVRIAFIRDSISSKRSRSAFLPIISVILAYILSVIFIFEPYYENPETLKGLYTANDPETTYAYIHKDGIIEIFLDGELAITTTEWHSSYDWLRKVYED